MAVPFPAQTGGELTGLCRPYVQWCGSGARHGYQVGG